MAIVAVVPVAPPVPTKTIVKLSALPGLFRSEVALNDTGTVMEVRALSLTEMIQLFIDSQDEFIPLYAAGLDGKFDVKQLAPFMASSPTLVARIIAMASGDPLDLTVAENKEALTTNAGYVFKHMPATVQLVALAEVWQLSVPDKKKARQLLSEVMEMLQKAGDEVQKQEVNPKPPPAILTIPSSPSLNS